jgi:hypothetical protein
VAGNDERNLLNCSAKKSKTKKMAPEGASDFYMIFNILEMVRPPMTQRPKIPKIIQNQYLVPQVHEILCKLS